MERIIRERKEERYPYFVSEQLLRYQFLHDRIIEKQKHRARKRQAKQEWKAFLELYRE